jgi:linoleoyl-CoA desaturase
MSVASNPITWQHQHTYAHHSHTNDENRDPDLHHFTGMIKLHPDREDDINRYKTKKNTFYIIMMFCQVTMGLCVWMPLRFVLDRSMHGVVNWTDRRRVLRTIGLLAHWVVYTTIVMILPVLVHETGAKALLAYITHSFASGLMFALVTQVGHLSEPTLDSGICEANKAKRHKDAVNSWAAEQVEHTTNFEPQSWLWFTLAGGLGLQVEHHLFPSLNHWHLMKIQPIIKQTCLEYGVAYKSFDNYFDALRATLAFMKKYQ